MRSLQRVGKPSSRKWICSKIAGTNALDFKETTSKNDVGSLPVFTPEMGQGWSIGNNPHKYGLRTRKHGIKSKQSCPLMRTEMTIKSRR